MLDRSSSAEVIVSRAPPEDQSQARQQPPLPGQILSAAIDLIILGLLTVSVFVAVPSWLGKSLVIAGTTKSSVNTTCIRNSPFNKPKHERPFASDEFQKCYHAITVAKGRYH